jgi:hypothetical protein
MGKERITNTPSLHHSNEFTQYHYEWLWLDGLINKNQTILDTTDRKDKMNKKGRANLEPCLTSETLSFDLSSSVFYTFMKTPYNNSIGYYLLSVVGYRF